MMAEAFVCYGNGKSSQLTFRFLSATANINREEKFFLCRLKFADLFLLNYSKEKSGI